MKKKLSKVLAVVLSLVMVAGLATVDASTAQAAKAKKLSVVSTGKKTVKSGKSRTIKIKGSKAKKAKWTVAGKGKKYVKITSKKKGKTLKFKVKANATGKVKFTAKLTKKNKVSVVYKLKCDAASITLDNAAARTNQVVELKVTKTPSNGVMSEDMTYSVFSDEEGKTSLTEGYVITPSGLSAQFCASKPAKYYVQATNGKLTTNIATVDVTDKLAKLESVKQTHKSTIVLTCDDDASLMKDTDLMITNQDGKRINVKTITLDATKKIATVVTLQEMADGKTYTVAYNDSEVKFDATNGEVTDIRVTTYVDKKEGKLENPLEVPINTDVPLVAVAIDAKNVILQTIEYGSQNTAFKDGTSYDFTIDAGTGSTNETTGTLRLEKIGDKATAKVVYTSNKLDANGTVITKDVTVTIVGIAEGNISTYKDYGFLNVNDDEETKRNLPKTFEAAKISADYKKNIRVGGHNNAGALIETYYIYALVKDDLGYTRIDGRITDKGYTLESADDTIALVLKDTIKAVREGNTFILVKDKDNKVILTLPVKVEARAVLSSIKLTKNSLTLTGGNVAEPSVRSNPGLYADSNDNKEFFDTRVDRTGTKSPTSDYDEKKTTGTIGWKYDDKTLTVEGTNQYNEAYSNFDIEVVGNTDTSKSEEVMKAVSSGHDVTVEGQVYPGEQKPVYDDNGKITNDTEDVLSRGESRSNIYKITATDRHVTSKKETKTFTARLIMPYAEGQSIKLDTEDKSVDTTLKTDARGLTSKNMYVIYHLAMLDSQGTVIQYEALPEKDEYSDSGRDDASRMIELKKDGSLLNTKEVWSNHEDGKAVYPIFDENVADLTGSYMLKYGKGQKRPIEGIPASTLVVVKGRGSVGTSALSPGSLTFKEAEGYKKDAVGGKATISWTAIKFTAHEKKLDLVEDLGAREYMTVSTDSSVQTYNYDLDTDNAKIVSLGSIDKLSVSIGGLTLKIKQFDITSTTAVNPNVPTSVALNEGSLFEDTENKLSDTATVATQDKILCSDKNPDNITLGGIGLSGAGINISGTSLSIKIVSDGSIENSKIMLYINHPNAIVKVILDEDETAEPLFVATYIPYGTTEHADNYKFIYTSLHDNEYLKWLDNSLFSKSDKLLFTRKEVKKAPAATYQIRVNGVELDSDNNVAKITDVKNNTAEGVSATLSVKDSQQPVVVGQDEKVTRRQFDNNNLGKQLDSVAMNTLRVTGKDKGAYADFASQKTGKPISCYYIHVPERLNDYDGVKISGYTLTDKSSVAFTTLDVYTPYWSGSKIASFKFTIPVNYTVTK